MSEPILIAHDLRKSFGGRETVKGISLQIARGEVFGLLGPNGAGKTTTISMLAALLEPTGGKITVNGLDLKTNTDEVKAQIGLVPQEIALYMTLSARQNLMFFGRIYGLRGKALRERVDEALQMLGPAAQAGDPVGSTSDGIQRRVSIAAGLLHKPQILFLDEPAAGVDPQSRNAIFAGIEALNRGGATVIYATHSMEEAQRLCHRVAIVDEGRIVALDTPAALIRGGALVSHLTGKTLRQSEAQTLNALLDQSH